MGKQNGIDLDNRQRIRVKGDDCAPVRVLYVRSHSHTHLPIPSTLNKPWDFKVMKVSGTMLLRWS